MIQPIFHFFDSVGSTNDIAIKMARDGAPEGTVIVADQQTSGRGRRGRVWLNEPGMSVQESIILRPPVGVSELPQVGFVAAVGCADFLAEQGLEARLKWPNDVLVGNKKIAGILVEIALSDKVSAAVVGIGVNVNHLSFSPELEDIATSIAMLTGKTNCARTLAESLGHHVLRAYDRYLAMGFVDTLNNWQTRMWGCGEQVEINMERRTICGVINGVDNTGALIVRDAKGSAHAIHAGDTIKTTRN